MMSKKVPELRFKGFTDDWEDRKVGNFLSESKIKGSDGSVSKKLTVKLWRKGIVPKEEIYKGSSATQYYIRLAGQFMYGKLDFLNQAFGILPKELDGYESTLDSPAFDFKDGINPNFFLEYVCRENFYKYQGNIANGSRKAKRIHADTFLDMPITIPSFEEQQKIGAFFKHLDDTIALYQRKLDLLKEQKKGFLQKMFPKNGEKVPELRFKGFTDDWEQRKLGDIAQINKGIQRGKQEISSVRNELNPYPVYNGGKKASGYTDEYNRENSVMVSEGGASAGYVNYYSGKYWSGGHNFTISNDTKHDTFFLLYVLQKSQEKLYKLQVGTGLPNIQLKSIKDFPIYSTSNTEQAKVGSFFKQLDDTIALYQRKLDLLKEQKKGFLQKMFV